MSGPAENDDAASADSTRLLVLVCTYNERENICECLARIRHAVPHADILVIDDDSPDGTAAAAAASFQQDARTRVKVRTAERGLGSAIRAGLRQAIEEGYDWVVNLDADLSHAPEDIPKLMHLARGPQRLDLAIGSRYVAHGRIIGWPWRRRMLSRLFNAASRLAGDLPVHDCTGSFRAYRVAFLRDIDLSHLQHDGYAFLEELLAAIAHRSGRIAEVPICFTNRQRGKSKLTWREGRGAIRMLYELRRSRRAAK